MTRMTVPGAGYTGKNMVQSAEVLIITAIEIAAALELEAYAAMRRAFHRHCREDTAESAGHHDAAIRAWQTAQTARDETEKRRHRKK